MADDNESDSDFTSRSTTTTTSTEEDPVIEDARDKKDEKETQQRDLKIDAFFNSIKTVPDWKDRQLHLEGHFISLEKIFSPTELKKIVGKLEWRLEILGSSFKIVPNEGLSGDSLYQSLSQCLTKKGKNASLIKKFIIKFIKDNWSVYEANVDKAYSDSEEEVEAANPGPVGLMTFPDYKRLTSKSNCPATPVELHAAAQLFRFNFCLILAAENTYFHVINFSHVDDGPRITTSRVTYYFLQTGQSFPEYRFELLRPASRFMTPINGTYRFIMRRVLVVDVQKTSEVTKNAILPRFIDNSDDLDRDRDQIMLVFACKDMEFIYKDTGIFPNTLYALLAELLYNSSINGYQVRENLDQHYMEQNPGLNPPLNADFKYLDLASVVYNFNYVLIHFNQNDGSCYSKVVYRNSSKCAEDPIIPWYYLMVKTSKIKTTMEWFGLHLLDDVEDVLDQIHDLKNDRQSSDKKHLWWIKNPSFLKEPTTEEDYVDGIDEYIESISYIFKAGSKNKFQKSLVVKPEYYQTNLRLHRPTHIPLLNGVFPFVEYAIEKDGSSRSIRPGVVESSYFLVDHTGGISEYLPYAALDQTRLISASRQLKMSDSSDTD